MRRKREDRAVTIPLAGAADGAALEGLYVAGAAAGCGGAVVAPPHPLYGGSMDSPVVCELAWACSDAGLASLRFNWRGCGASAGTPSGEPAAADADFGAALAQLAASVPGELIAAGYSFGACAALRAAARERRVRGLILVAPPPGEVTSAGLAQLGARILVLVGECDRIAPADALEARAAGHARVQVVRIPEADHFFAAGLGGVAAATRRWLDAA